MSHQGLMRGLGLLAMLAACASEPAAVVKGNDGGSASVAIEAGATGAADDLPVDASGGVDAEQPTEATADAGGEPTPCRDPLGLPLLSEPPDTLAETGLYLAGAADPRDFAPHARLFQPQFELWSDGAKKQRFFYLPACTQVDTSDMDYWRFPVGSRFWKEFSLDGTLLETRFIHRFGPGDKDWLFATYQWDLKSLTPERAMRVADGAQNVNGTQHDVPAQRACQECHVNLPEPPLAFSAIQLSHSLPGETLQSLSKAGWLTHPATRDYAPPGDEATRAGLGYLHANCGHCHNSHYRTHGNSLDNEPAPRMRLSVRNRYVEDTTTYTTLVGMGTFNPTYRAYSRIEPCNPQLSSVLLRMATRSPEQMPPIATEVVHEAGIELVSRLLETLHAPGAPACPVSQ